MEKCKSCLNFEKCEISALRSELQNSITDGFRLSNIPFVCDIKCNNLNTNNTKYKTIESEYTAKEILFEKLNFTYSKSLHEKFNVNDSYLIYIGGYKINFFNIIIFILERTYFRNPFMIVGTYHPFIPDENSICRISLTKPKYYYINSKESNSSTCAIMLTDFGIGKLNEILKINNKSLWKKIITYATEISINISYGNAIIPDYNLLPRKC